jgi:hypothetical protein
MPQGEQGGRQAGGGRRRLQAFDKRVDGHRSERISRGVGGPDACAGGDAGMLVG